jgi:hypothetical protein
MRQYRLLSSCLLAVLVLGCFTSNSQAQYCFEKYVAASGMGYVVFPAYITPGLTGPPVKKARCYSVKKGCLCHAKYCNSTLFLLDMVLVSSPVCVTK